MRKEKTRYTTESVIPWDKRLLYCSLLLSANILRFSPFISAETISAVPKIHIRLLDFGELLFVG